MRNLRILFTSACRTGEPFDFYGFHTKTRIRLSQPRVLCPGLRFIHQNLPQIEILELPSWTEYTKALSQGWDIVGFSFFTFETNEVLKMAEYARSVGVPELWAGNYGALNPLIESAFDKVIIGYSEEKIARELGADIGEFAHPALLDSMGVEPIGSDLIRVAWLYTARGCPLKCTFCQTPAFADSVVETPLDSIDRVLRQYKRSGVQLVQIFDENFGIAHQHSREVVGLLRKHDLPWGVMTRSDILKANFDEWHDSGMMAVVIGIEAMNSDSLRDIRKVLSVEQTTSMLQMLHRRGVVATGTYMVGFERDTLESVSRDFQELSRLRPDFIKLYVVTPYPKTPLWDHIEKIYGIDCSDWSKFNGRYLVWNHPYLSRADAQRILVHGYRLFNSEEHVLRFVSKVHRRLVERGGPFAAHSFFFSGLRDKLHSRVGWKTSVG
ncbi:MAG: radical SAM protein [Acidobacteriia bacterium]|nr:radical SAM protein [Terriglobia bacterium]